ncbi:hypothetical protein WA026_009482 [Henosepilachna vigintioctopunctata]|uniref:Uncharacterized protein n=1 Tax=Henosepilachna vigintioctopunctata TaxID=420089 RepID=A0AAW1U6Y5_9CUCU
MSLTTTPRRHLRVKARDLNHFVGPHQKAVSLVSKPFLKMRHKSNCPRKYPLVATIASDEYEPNYKDLSGNIQPGGFQ